MAMDKNCSHCDRERIRQVGTADVVDMRSCRGKSKLQQTTAQYSLARVGCVGYGRTYYLLDGCRARLMTRSLRIYRPFDRPGDDRSKKVTRLGCIAWMQVSIVVERERMMISQLSTVNFGVVDRVCPDSSPRSRGARSKSDSTRTSYTIRIISPTASRCSTVFEHCIY
jgi:hypothetical protein